MRGENECDVRDHKQCVDMLKKKERKNTICLCVQKWLKTRQWILIYLLSHRRDGLLSC
jgi:hypothetical protein